MDGEPDGPVLRLKLADVEKTALVDFLKTLTDQRILNDPKFSNPFLDSKIIIGDVNRDGFINGLDIVPFVNALVDGIYQFEADIDLDGRVNLLDVDLFVDLLLGN